MPTQMGFTGLKLLPSGHPHTQKVAVLNKPYDISIAHADIPTAKSVSTLTGTMPPAPQSPWKRR